MANSEQPGLLRRALAKFLLFDLLADKQARPIYLYVMVTTLIGAVIYHFVEGWGWLDSVYFVVITTTTIGYGDLAPTTGFGKLITIFFALNGVAILVMLLDQIRRVRVTEADTMRSLHEKEGGTTGDSQEGDTTG